MPGPARRAAAKYSPCFGKSAGRVRFAFWSGRSRFGNGRAAVAKIGVADLFSLVPIAKKGAHYYWVIDPLRQ